MANVACHCWFYYNIKRVVLFTWNFISDADLPFACLPGGFEFSLYDSSGLASVTSRYW